MDHWTIGDAELRRGVSAQAERYTMLRRRSDEVRLLRQAPGGRPGPLLQLIRRLYAALRRQRRGRLPGAAGSPRVDLR